MKKNLKNLMALVLTGAMLTCGTSAFAAIGFDDANAYTGNVATTGGAVTGGGSGITITGVDTISVEVPVSTTDAFDFVIDPSHLMAKYAAANGSDVTFDPMATVLFKNYDEEGANVVARTGQSDNMSFRNAGRKPINLKINIKSASNGEFVDTAASGKSNVTLADNAKFDGTKPAVDLLATLDGVQNHIGAGTKVGTTVKTGTEVLTAGVDMYAMLPDARQYFALTQGGNDQTFEYNLSDEVSSDRTVLPTVNFNMAGMADAAFDWASGEWGSGNTIDPTKIKIDYKWELAKIADPNTVTGTTEVVEMTGKTTDSVTVVIPGFKKYDTTTKTGTNLSVKALSSSKLSDADLNSMVVTMEASTIASDIAVDAATNKVTIKGATLQNIYNALGTCEIVVWGNGAQGARAKLRPKV